MKFIIPALVISFIPLLNSQTTKVENVYATTTYGQASRSNIKPVYPAFSNEEINEVQNRVERPDQRKREEAEPEFAQNEQIQIKRPHPTPMDRDQRDHPILGQDSAGLGRKKHGHHGHKEKRQKHGRNHDRQDERNYIRNEQQVNDNPQMEQQPKKRAHRGLGWMAYCFIISAVCLAVILIKRCARRRCQRRMRRAQQVQQQNQQAQQGNNVGLNLREQIKYHYEQAKRLQSLLAQSQQRIRQQRNIQMRIPQTIPQVYYNNQNFQQPQINERIVNSYPIRAEKIPVGRPLVEQSISYQNEYPRME